MTILAIVVMAKYKLTDAFHAQILGEIKARRSLESSGAEPIGAEARCRDLPSSGRGNLAGDRWTGKYLDEIILQPVANNCHPS